MNLTARMAAIALVAIGMSFSSADFSHATPCGQNTLLGVPTPIPIGPNPVYLALGDFNEDGHPDVAACASDFQNGGINGSVAVLLGNGGLSFAAAVSYTVGRNPHGITTGDFNEDGITDLAVGNKSGNSISILLGTGSGGVGNGGFTSGATLALGDSPHQVIAADLDRDGHLDLATAINNQPRVQVLRGLGDGSFGPPVTFPLANLSVGITTGDFNEDGNPDLIATEYTSGTIALMLGTGAPTLGAGSFGPATHFSAGIEPFNIAVADFNEDGHSDLAVGNSNSGGTRILLGNGNGTFTVGITLASGNSAILLPVDLNDDGILDLVIPSTTGTNTGLVRVFLGNGTSGVGNGTFGAEHDYSTGSDPYAPISADFDGDGYRDVVVSNYTRTTLSVFPGVCPVPPPDPRNPVITDVRDVPNDNGGRAFVTWSASSLDSAGGAVNQYRVWRRIPPGSLATTPLESVSALRTVTRATRPDGTTELVYWEALNTLPAQRLPGYGYTAATTQDSLHSGNPYTAFFVSALTSNIEVFYNSNVDSGYSVDNLRPAPPQSLIAQMTPQGIQLGWEANQEPDVVFYRLYRGPSPDFVPQEWNLVAQVTDIAYSDIGATGADYYKLSAVDAHENQSDFATLAPLVPAGAGNSGAVGFALHGVRPNPARGERWAVDFSLASSAGARLDVLDPAGRRVVSQDLTAYSPGRHTVSVTGAERLPAGLYLLRLTQGASRRELKAVIVQ